MGILMRRVPLKRASLNRKPPEGGQPLPRGTRIPPVSRKRARKNRERRAMAQRRFPGMNPDCSVKGCLRKADDLHEALTRARGGSITDEENTFPVCRQHNEELTLEPAWGYEQGLLKHSGLCCVGRRVCSRYEAPAGAA
jgi:hypothetical protein